jgi:hypothetical protein
MSRLAAEGGEALGMATETELEMQAEVEAKARAAAETETEIQAEAAMICKGTTLVTRNKTMTTAAVSLD